jgi:hypothetical protein
LVKLVPVKPLNGPRQPGSGKGKLLWMASDFDAIPEGFEFAGSPRRQSTMIESPAMA